MYKNLKTYTPDSRDPKIQKEEIIAYFQKEFFDKENVYSISKALQDKGVTSEKYAIYRQCAEINIADIQKTLANKTGTFRNDYSKMVYLLGLLKNHISEDIKPAEPNQQKEPPAPPPKLDYRPSWMDELEADCQPPKQASAEDKPAISNTDLFETEPDTIHGAWAKLNESERRKNWEEAIARHRQQRKPEYAPDEMY